VAAPRAVIESDVAEAAPDSTSTEATETRPLRPKPSARASRSASDAAAPEHAGAAWPWFLLGTGAFAGLGALWFWRSRGAGARSDRG
jgi:hypothetical protein